MSVVHNFKIIFSFITLQSDRQMSEREEDILSVVASTWSEGDNAEKTDGCEAVDEMEDMETDITYYISKSRKCLGFCTSLPNLVVVFCL
jgi:hypothetical protein